MAGQLDQQFTGVLMGTCGDQVTQHQLADRHSGMDGSLDQAIPQVRIGDLAHRALPLVHDHNAVHPLRLQLFGHLPHRPVSHNRNQYVAGILLPRPHFPEPASPEGHRPQLGPRFLLMEEPVPVIGRIQAEVGRQVAPGLGRPFRQVHKQLPGETVQDGLRIGPDRVQVRLIGPDSLQTDHVTGSPEVDQGIPLFRFIDHPQVTLLDHVQPLVPRLSLGKYNLTVFVELDLTLTGQGPQILYLEELKWRVILEEIRDADGNGRAFHLSIAANRVSEAVFGYIFANPAKVNQSVRFTGSCPSGPRPWHTVPFPPGSGPAGPPPAEPGQVRTR